MSNKCVLVLPYFGVFNNYFPLFLRSCAANPNYDFLIYTDQVLRETPPNVYCKHMDFNEFRFRIQSKFDFPISLQQPYKLCDFKPSYGYVLEDDLNSYDYWGHCDCDLLFGGLDGILNPLMAERYDKIFAAGHLTLYRNDSLNLRRFMAKDSEGVELYRIAYSNPESFAFDEALYKRNVHSLFLSQGAKVYEKDHSFNVSTHYYGIRREYFNPDDGLWRASRHGVRHLVWKEGCVSSFKERDTDEEYWLYAHMQRRAPVLYPGVLDSGEVEIGPDFLSPYHDNNREPARANAKGCVIGLRHFLGRTRGCLKRYVPTDIDPYSRFVN